MLSFATDAGQSIATLGGMTLDRPWVLLLALLPVIALPWFRYTRRRTEAKRAQLGAPEVLGLPSNRSRRTRIINPAAGLAAWLLILIGAAGPRWGRTQEEGVAIGRDVVLMIDLSRSMWAADMASTQTPERWQAARQSALELVESLKRAGGYRIGVVVFAARPVTLAPLTTDMGYVANILETLDGRSPPPGVRPLDSKTPSGSRIGAALSVAVELHDPRLSDVQDIVLWTDGDDPAEDREWDTGARLAASAGIPVHVIALGNPDRESLIFQGDAPLEFENAEGIRIPVQSRLHEDVTRAIAEITGGIPLAAHTNTPPIQDIVQVILADPSQRELTGSPAGQKRKQSGWFLGSGVCLLVVFWWRR